MEVKLIRDLLIDKLKYMKNVLKLTLAVCGFALATIASTSEVKAGDKPSSIPGNPGCYSSGQCGVTANGTILIGSWRE